MDNLPRVLETVGRALRKQDRRLDMFLNTVIFVSIGIVAIIIILLGKRL